MQDVLDALLDAIANLPQRRDSRSDPIFEPHFKLVSVVHKLVLRENMTVSATVSTFQMLFTDKTLARRSEQDSSCVSLGSESGRSR